MNSKLKEFQDNYEPLVRRKTIELINETTELQLAFERLGNHRNINNQIPNLGITYSNKINELARIFEDAGLSIYAREEEGEVRVSSLGDAIIQNLRKRMWQVIQELSECVSTYGKVIKKDERSLPIVKMKIVLSKLFGKEKESYFLEAKQDVEKIEVHLSNIRKSDDELYNYELRGNIVESVLDYVKGYVEERQLLGMDMSDIRKMTEKSIIPDMVQLGFGDLVPQLRQELAKILSQEEKTKKSWELSREDEEKQGRNQLLEEASTYVDQINQKSIFSELEQVGLSDVVLELQKELDEILPQQEKRNKSWELSPKDIEEQRLQQVGIAEKHREEKKNTEFPKNVETSEKEPEQ